MKLRKLPVARLLAGFLVLEGCLDALPQDNEGRVSQPASAGRARGVAGWRSPRDPLAGVQLVEVPDAAALSEADRASMDLPQPPDKLRDIAVALADGSSPADHDLLKRHLVAGGFLNRLDSPKDYQGTYPALRLSQVVKALSKNPNRSARRVLLCLIDSPDFQKEVLRVQLLIHALAPIKLPPTAVANYWDKHSQSGSSLSYDVVEALCINQSDAALGLLERKFADPRQDPDHKIAWMRQLILPRRNDDPLLLCCERLLTNSLPEKLRPALIEAVFEYKPEWYRDEDPPQPPALAAASPQAARILSRLALDALKQPWLDSEQRDAVTNALRALRR